MSGLPIIDLTGDAVARGRAHGAALTPLIKDNIETYLARFEAGGIRREDTLAEGARWAERIATFDPEYAAEMAAIADAAGLDIAPIGVLNARWELTYSLYAKEATYEQVDGCTAFAALPEVTRSGTMLLGQNWDWLKGLIGRMAVLALPTRRRPRFHVHHASRHRRRHYGSQRSRHRIGSQWAHHRPRRRRTRAQAVPSCACARSWAPKAWRPHSAQSWKRHACAPPTSFLGTPMARRSMSKRRPMTPRRSIPRTACSPTPTISKRCRA